MIDKSINYKEYLNLCENYKYLDVDYYYESDEEKLARLAKEKADERDRKIDIILAK